MIKTEKRLPDKDKRDIMKNSKILAAQTVPETSRGGCLEIWRKDL